MFAGNEATITFIAIAPGSDAAPENEVLYVPLRSVEKNIDGRFGSSSQVKSSQVKSSLV